VAAWLKLLSQRPKARQVSIREIAQRLRRLTPHPEAGQREAGLAASYFSDGVYLKESLFPRSGLLARDGF
jgi:hypothetical protein